MRSYLADYWKRRKRRLGTPPEDPRRCDSNGGDEGGEGGGEARFELGETFWWW